MQRGRADARQLSRAVSPANNGTSPGRLIPPCWDREGNRVLLPPAPRPPAQTGCAHPLPVDLSALGDETKIPLRRPLGNSKAIRLPAWESLSGSSPTDRDDLASTVRPATSPRATNERRTRRLRLQLKQRWKRVCPAVKLRSGLKAAHPDISITAVVPNA